MGDGLHRRDARSRTAAGFRRIPRRPSGYRGADRPLQSDLPVLPPETVVYPDKTGLLRGRTISLARRQDRLQRFGAMASGAAAAAVLFGGLLFFHPGEGTKGPSGLRQKRQKLTPKAPKRSPHGSTDRRQPTRGMTRRPLPEQETPAPATASPPPFRQRTPRTLRQPSPHITETPATAQRPAARALRPDPPGRETAPLPLRLSNARMRLRPRERLPKQVFSKIRCRRKVCWVRCRSLPNSTCRNLP